MACTASKTPLLRTVAARGFAAQASASPRAAPSKSSEVQVTTLPNKLVVASVDGNLPLSRVSVVFRAGSRNESYDNLGVTHVLRATAGQTNKKSTSFGVTRNIQRVGGSLTATTDRELVSYNVELTRNNLDTGLKFLQDASTQQVFKPWEVDSVVSRIQGDLARVTQPVRAVDLLHRAAFRTELGNSVFCAKHHVGRIGSETLQHYVASNFTSDRAAVVGVGIDHHLLVAYAKNLYLEPGTSSTVASKYHGLGELRVDKAGELATVAVATQGASLSNQKEALAFAVLQQVAGTGAAAKRGGNNGALGKIVSSALSNPFGFTALNVSYTDNGLFGFVLTANAREVGKAVDAAVKALKSGSVSSADVIRGKEQLKAAVLGELDTSAGLAEDIVQQAALSGKVQSSSELVAAIDALTVADVNAAAKKVASGKWSVGAVGNLANVPYVSDLN